MTARYGPDEARLRPWQRQALQSYDEVDRRSDFLVTATPGAGKTTFALAVAGRLLGRRAVDRVVVVCPTDHLRTQWADAAGAFGIVLDPALANSAGPVPDGALGYVTTYAQVAQRPAIHAARSGRKRTLVILDEVHHAGDGFSWGEAVGEAFTEVQRRLCLTGTPFRTRAGERIPFVQYQQDGDLLRSVADYTYGYKQALADGVVRPVVFAAYSGVSRWRNSAGEVLAASLTDSGTRSVEAAAWKTALDPRGGWVPHVLAAMDERITALRSAGMKDAAGLVLASDQDAAREYAHLVKRITGEAPALILSDDPTASKRIEQFRDSDQRIAVCVRMISEGVDIPRAACLAWMTSYRTPLFFAQAVGRVVRARSRRESATVFLPAVRPLLALAAELEIDRNHVMAPPPKTPVDEMDELADPLLDMPEPVERMSETHESVESQAEFAHILHSGRAVTATGGEADDADAPEVDPYEALGADAEGDDFLGLPGLLSAEQMAQLLSQRDAELRRRVESVARERQDGPPEPVDAEIAGWRAAAALRREVNQLVSRVAGRTGTPHAKVHAAVRRAVPGPPSAAAGPDLLERRRDHLLGLL
ncbi:restriction endonuclease subunit R [Nakamurella flava]|uniref:Restriction endonuclease subunit R n=1 Tax=Nakamurella flava TaxID=2576308 RepID=A0A4U6QJ01_9ACTN|nr:DEAD/DEAH box helicase family protein [Nakamurella flava]TKV60241.1 restriction endonuclease subunit R [Nakamurella flava]